jgi:hypothetical protein
MHHPAVHQELTFDDLVASLHRGDFSWLAPMFEGTTSGSMLAGWLEGGRFATAPSALNEAATCACFLGRTAWVDYLLDHGADPIAGAGTGLNGFHWAANRGQLETVKALIVRHLPMEIRNSYGGTVLGGTVWAAVNEPRPTHPAVIEALLVAGADVREAEYPSGNAAVDTLLRRFAAPPGTDA